MKQGLRFGGLFKSAGASLIVLTSLAPWSSAAQAGQHTTFPFTPILDGRVRYELVDQEGPLEEAEAVTARLRFGLETPAFEGFSMLAEGEIVVPLVDDYNSTTNGHTQYAVIPDPDTLELNRAQISYASDSAKAVIGRQRIIFDNARFIGNVGWRQNEQTYDAAMGALTVVPDLTLSYAYVNKVHRIFGNESAVGEFDSESHLINVKYTGLTGFTLSGYAYFLDLQEAPGASTETFGLRAVYSTEFAQRITLALTGEYANQANYGDNPRDVDLNYYLISAGAKTLGLDVSTVYEVLEGDGAIGFSTPLATLHAFQGWADVFLATPAAGIRDFYGRVGYATGPIGPFAKVIGAVIYHDFEAEQSGAPLGEEVDLLLKGVVSNKFSVTAKYASYDGPAVGPASRDKFWLQLDWKL